MGVTAMALGGVLQGFEVGGYGLWDVDNPRYGEFVRLVNPEDPSQNLRWSLDKSINGERPAVGSSVDVAFQVRFKVKSGIGRDGRAWGRLAESYRVMELAAA